MTKTVKSLGEMLRYLRLQSGVTGSDLSGRIGVTTSYISAVEKGRIMPSPERTVEIEQVLSLPLGTLGSLNSVDLEARIRHLLRTVPECIETFDRLATLIEEGAEIGGIEITATERRLTDQDGAMAEFKTINELKTAEGYSKARQEIASQARVSRVLGVTVSTLSRRESRKQDISTEAAFALAFLSQNRELTNEQQNDRENDNQESHEDSRS